MKTLKAWLLFLALLMLANVGTADAWNNPILERAMGRYNTVILPEQTEQIDISDSETNEVIMALYCTRDAGDGKVLRTSICTYPDIKRDYAWNAYDAGERALSHVMMLKAVGYSIADTDKPVPVGLQDMEALIDSCDGGFTIRGFDSAYAFGTETMEDGTTLRWEVFPFCIVAADNTDFENAVYTYFSFVIDEGDHDLVYCLIDADQMQVCNLLGDMVDLNPALSQEDRQMMLLYIQYNELLEQEAAERSAAARDDALLGEILPRYQAYLDAEAEDAMRLSGGDVTQTLYGFHAVESTAAFFEFACVMPASGAAAMTGDLGNCQNALIDVMEMARSLHAGMVYYDLPKRAIAEAYSDLAVAFGMNLICYETWYRYGQAEDTGVRWEIVPFSYYMPMGLIESVPILSRPNLYVHMLTPQADGTMFSEEWIIEDEQTISALLPGSLEDIQVNIDAAQEKMSRQNEEQDTPARQADDAA